LEHEKEINMNKTILIMIILFSVLLGQGQSDVSLETKTYQVSRERFITNESGNILMFVNVWGHVNSPGRHTVYDGIDMATLLSIVGGPKTGANLKKIRVFREIPDTNGEKTYILNLDSFFKTGDRSAFIHIKPNDTILIPQKWTNTILSQVGTLNTFMGLFNLYLQLESRVK